MTDPRRHYWGVLSTLPAPAISMLARQAEAQGLEGVFAPQVYGPPWVPLAAAAAVTERLRLASGIAIAAARSPFETAMVALDLDRLSGGRFVLGLGASVQSWTRGVYGAPEHKPLAHLRETVAAVRHVIRGAHRGLEPFEGSYYRADFAELQPTPEPLREEIPIWLAALRGPAVRLAAEVADGVMGHPMWSLDWAVERIQPDLQKGLARSGRKREDVELNLWLWCAPGVDEATAIEDARPTIAFYAGVAQYESFFAAHGFGDEARRLQEYVRKREILDHGALVPDEMVRAFVICGPPYAVPPEKQLHYAAETAKLFYG
jgi:probable F420-dependent oxidoreductase